MSTSKPPKLGTFPYKIKWIIIRYGASTVDDEGFKEQLSNILREFPMSSESAAVCICKYLLDKEKYGPLSVDDVKHVADLVSEVDPGVGGIIQDWIKETYG